MPTNQHKGLFRSDTYMMTYIRQKCNIKKITQVIYQYIQSGSKIYYHKFTTRTVLIASCELGMLGTDWETVPA